MNNDQKTYDLLLKKLLFLDIKKVKIDFNYYNININDFKKMFIENIKKSSKLAQILPCVIFLLISLLSFSVAYFSLKLTKYWGELSNPNLKIGIILFGIVFLLFSLGLFIKRYILNIKSVYINSGYYKGFKNISKKKYEDIISLLNSYIK